MTDGCLALVVMVTSGLCLAQELVPPLLLDHRQPDVCQGELSCQLAELVPEACQAMEMIMYIRSVLCLAVLLFPLPLARSPLGPADQLVPSANAEASAFCPYVSGIVFGCASAAWQGCAPGGAPLPAPRASEHLVPIRWPIGSLLMQSAMTSFMGGKGSILSVTGNGPGPGHLQTRSAMSSFSCSGIL